MTGHFNGPPNGSSGALAPAGNPSDTISIREIIRFLIENTTLIALVTAASVIAALCYVTFSTPSYRASASVIFDPTVSSALLNDRRSQTIETNAQINSQVEMIKAGRVAAKVVNDLNLTSDPEFVGGGSWLSLGIADAANSAAQTAVSPVKTEAAIVSLQNRLSVSRIGESTALEITFYSKDADKAGNIANAIAKAYVDISLQEKSQVAKNGAKWFQQRIDELRARAFQASLDVEKFSGIRGASVADAKVRLAELESVAQSYRKIYESFLTKFFETEQLVSYPVADASVLSFATSGATQKYPKAKAILAFSLVAGLLAGISLALVRQALDHTIRSPAQLAALPGTTYYGHVPLVRSSSGKRYQSLAQVLDHPPDALNLAMRKARSILLSEVPRSRRVIGVSSINTGEGKSVVAASIAAKCAASGHRTLLVDTGQYNRGLSQVVAPTATEGLFDIIGGSKSFDDVIQHVSISEVSLPFIPSGRRSTADSFADLLDGPQEWAGFSDLRNVYDIILVDLPAVDADMMAVAKHLDGAILVAEEGRTRLEACQALVGKLLSIKPMHIGTVLNTVSNQTHATTSKSDQNWSNAIGPVIRKKSEPSSSRGILLNVRRGTGPRQWI